MGLDKIKKSNRLLASRRYTHETLENYQEAFTSVLDINTSEVYSQANLIYTASLPYSASGQDLNVYYSGSNATYPTGDPSGDPIAIFYHRFRMTPSNVVNGTKTEVWFFVSSSTQAQDYSAIDPQLLQDNQQSQFISPKYSTASIANNFADDNTPGYNARIEVFDGATYTPQNAANYQFDYRET